MDLYEGKADSVGNFAVGDNVSVIRAGNAVGNSFPAIVENKIKCKSRFTGDGRGTFGGGDICFWTLVDFLTCYQCVPGGIYSYEVRYEDGTAERVPALWMSPQIVSVDAAEKALEQVGPIIP